MIAIAGVMSMNSDTGPSIKNRILSLIAVIAGGLAGFAAKVPAGALIGGLVAGLLVKYFTGLPDHNTGWLSVTAQLLVAYVIVTSVDLSSLKTIPRLVPVAIAYGFILLVFSLVMAYLFAKFFDIDLFTAFFAMPPGGLSGLGIAAVDTGANAPVVILFHIIRIVVIVIMVPLAAKLFCG